MPTSANHRLEAHATFLRMYLWRRLATQRWADDNQEKLWTLAGSELAVITRPDRKRIQLEVASGRRAALLNLAKQFGGRIEKLPRNWLKQSLRRKTKPIKVGNRTLVIPAGAAFGTGEHATTAMCLRILERVMRLRGAHPPSHALLGASPEGFFQNSRSRRRDRRRPGRARSPELVVDLGTGSGVLALAANILGAKRVIGIDNDPVAISTAKENATLNKLRGAKFCVADVRNLRFDGEVDVLMANLFSELLIEIAPKLRAARRLILSGILGNQEGDVRRALTRIKFQILEVRRRGKWVAILAARK